MTDSAVALSPTARVRRCHVQQTADCTRAQHNELQLGRALHLQLAVLQPR